MSLIDPFTGEVLDPDDYDRLMATEAKLDTYLRGFGVLYGVRRELRIAITEIQGPYPAPPPRWRTDIQDRAVRCPRCEREIE